MNINAFFKNNRSSLLSILLALVIFCCLVGPIWSFHSASTTAYGEEFYSYTGEPVYKAIYEIGEPDINGNLRTTLSCGVICFSMGVFILAFAIASLFVRGKVEMILKDFIIGMFATIVVCAMVMMITVGSEIHALEQGYGIYGFLVGPGPICTFFFGIVGLVLNAVLIGLKLDGNAYKIGAHEEKIEHKEHGIG